MTNEMKKTQQSTFYYYYFNFQAFVFELTTKLCVCLVVKDLDVRNLRFVLVKLKKYFSIWSFMGPFLLGEGGYYMSIYILGPKF